MLAILHEVPALYLTAAGLLGLIVGSFLNVVILRLPARMEHEWRCECADLMDQPAPDTEPPGLVKPRSSCPECGHQITALENIPVVSYLVLRGKCSKCGVRISLQYPAVEALTGLMTLVVAWHFGLTWQALAAAVATWILIAASMIDLRTQLLPDNLTLPLLWLGLLISIGAVFVGPVPAIIGAAVGYMLLWTVFQLFKLVTGKEGMGHGDFKLMAALGAWLGWESLPLVIILSAAVGALVGVALIASKKQGQSEPMPFGPFIAAAGWIALLWGDAIIDAYLRFSGLA